MWLDFFLEMAEKTGIESALDVGHGAGIKKWLI